MRMYPGSSMRTAIAAIGTAAVVAAPTAAAAGPTRVTGGLEQDYGYHLKAAPGTANNLSVTTRDDGAGGVDYVFTDPAGLITNLYISCRAADGGEVFERVHQTLICGGPLPEQQSDASLRIESGDGTDRIDVALGALGVPQILKGEGGNDTIAGASAPAPGASFFDPLLDGGPGNDVLRSGSNHKLKGRGGVDKLFAANGIRNPKINCGAGSDKTARARVDRKAPEPKSC
jgi:hypothetical protein